MYDEFLSLPIDTFETPSLGLPKGRERPLKIWNIKPHFADCLKLDTIVPLDRKLEERLDNLGILGCFLEKIWQENNIFHERAGRNSIQNLEEGVTRFSNDQDWNL